MAKPVTVFSGVLGLNNREHPSRLEADERGNVELAEAVNIDISGRGKPRRRKGQRASAITQGCHSFFVAGDTGYCVSGSKLLRVTPDFVTSALRFDLTPDLRMSFCAQAGKLFYANGQENGYIEAGSSHAWDLPQTDWQAVDSARSFSAPPVGHKLAAAFGRVWIAQDNVLWFTEPYAPFFCDLARNAIPFPTRVREIVPVQDGLFVSTMRQTVFLAGGDPRQMRQIDIRPEPLIPGTAVVAAPEDIGYDQVPQGILVVATMPSGICLLGSGGFCVNLTAQRVVLPGKYSEGAAYMYNGKYVVSLR